MATVLARVPLLKDSGYDYTKVVHGEQRLALMSDLRKAVDNDELALIYQPKVALGESGEAVLCDLCGHGADSLILD